MEVKDFVAKDNLVRFDSFRNGIFYYNVAHTKTGLLHQFQVPIEDVSGVTLIAHDKSVTYMRWIRKSIENKTLIKIESYA